MHPVQHRRYARHRQHIATAHELIREQDEIFQLGGTLRGHLGIHAVNGHIGGREQHRRGAVQYRRPELIHYGRFRPGGKPRNPCGYGKHHRDPEWHRPARPASTRLGRLGVRDFQRRRHLHAMELRYVRAMRQIDPDLVQAAFARIIKAQPLADLTRLHSYRGIIARIVGGRAPKHVDSDATFL